MKRLGSSESLGALMSICRATDENDGAEAIYGRELQSMLDSDGCGEELAVGGPSEKKRRLRVEQVKALEKNFEVENKLEPERKVKLAQELGLQPRQVAVWFQNRRARWKTKQLERDYGVLRANYDSLKLSFDALNRNKDILLQEIEELKSKVNGENSDQSNLSIKTAATAAAHSESEITKLTVETKPMPPLLPPLDLKEPNHSSDSDTSAILTEENATSSSPSNAATSSAGAGALQTRQQSPMMFQLHYVKLEEHNFFGDEVCKFFSDEQAPTLHWYCSDQWN